MDLVSKYLQCNPWPGRGQSQVLFILDARNPFEQGILRGWIQHHAQGADKLLQASQVCLDLGDDRRGIDSTSLVMALVLPADTLVAPLRVAWLPSQEAINSGPRLRDLLFGDPRHPGAWRGRRIVEKSPERMHLLMGEPDTVANLRVRFGRVHSADNGDAQRDFADFVARQAVVVLDLAERRLQGGRYNS